MEDAGFVAASTDTTRIISFAPSKSQHTSEASTRGSTPTKNRAEWVPVNSVTLKPFDQDETADDVTMKEIGSRRKRLASSADESSDPKVVSWLSNPVIDPDLSPWKAGETKEEPMDCVSDSKKLEELLTVNDLESPDVYKL